MDYHINRFMKHLASSILVVLFLFLGQGGSVAQETGISEVTFIVK